MGGQRRWRHGGVVYPVKTSTANTLLEDADPALYYAAQLFESVIETYVGPRLLAQAALEDLDFPSAVEKVINVEPTPYLLSDQMTFPLFCLWRSEESWAERNIANNVDASVWEWSYVLPPLTPRQIEQLHPILRTVAVVVSSFAMQSFDPDYEDGATLRDLSGIQKMMAGRVRYGSAQELADGDVARWWKMVHGQLLVWEQSSLVAEELEAFEGVRAQIDMTDAGGTKVDSFVVGDVNAPPVVESVSPASGTKAGGASLTVDGANFLPGAGTPRVLVGGAYASAVVVVHPTRIVCLTPEHEAYPTFAADVQVVNPDGTESNVLEAAYTFTTP